MPIIPEPIVRCPKCGSHVADIDPKWIAQASQGSKPVDPRNPVPQRERGFSHIRKQILEAWREVGPLKGWMTQGECPEPECDGKWWNGTTEKLTVAVPHHVKEAKDDDRRGYELRDDAGNERDLCDPSPPASGDASRDGFQGVHDSDPGAGRTNQA